MPHSRLKKEEADTRSKMLSVAGLRARPGARDIRQNDCIAPLSALAGDDFFELLSAKMAVDPFRDAEQVQHLSL